MNDMSLFENNIILPTEEQLSSISFRSSFGKSLNKRQLSEELLNVIKQDSVAYYNIALSYDWLFDYDWRIKTIDSIEKKYLKGLDRSLRFNSVFNDLLGLRIKVPSYNVEIPDYFRIVDMRNGKRNYDGYKAIHLYYQRDNYSYQIEIQLWSEEDFNFNNWSHLIAYKVTSDAKLAEIRKLYDAGFIKSYANFEEALNV